MALVLSAFVDGLKQIHQWVGNGFESDFPSMRFYILEGLEKDFWISWGSEEQTSHKCHFLGKPEDDKALTDGENGLRQHL